MGDYDGPPMIRADVRIKGFQISIMRALSEEVRPFAEDIQRQVEHAIQNMDLEKELADVVSYQAKETIRDMVKRQFRDTIHQEKWEQKFQALVEEYADKYLNELVEAEVKHRVRDTVYSVIGTKMRATLGEKVETYVKELLHDSEGSGQPD
ncbi:hypothetical protein LCGC14_0164420 [marine sediment metagenome]|uniref:Uncharacterized protein n=1 Tax=marine sediment metagenome TaxID=412755 RepID=A0A0F9XWN0_9ZZZZ